MKTISRILTNTMLVAALFIGFSACGQTDNSTSKEVKEIKIKSDFESAHCKTRIEEGIGQEKGVKAVIADLTNQIVTIKYQSDKNTEEALTEALKKLGYAANVISNNNVTAKCPKDGHNCTKEDSVKCSKEMKHDCKAKTTSDTIKSCKHESEKGCCKKK